MIRAITLLVCFTTLVSCGPAKNSGQKNLSDGRVIRWTDNTIVVFQDGKQLALVTTPVNLYSVHSYADNRLINEVRILKWRDGAELTYSYKYDVPGRVHQATYERSFEPTNVSILNADGSPIRDGPTSDR